MVRHWWLCFKAVFQSCYAVRLCVPRRKQQRPGIALNDNTTRAPSARSSADPTRPNHTPTRHTRAKDKMILQMVTPQAATHTRRTYTGTRPHAPGHQAGHHPVPAHTASQPVEGVDATTSTNPPASRQQAPSTSTTYRSFQTGADRRLYSGRFTAATTNAIAPLPNDRPCLSGILSRTVCTEPARGLDSLLHKASGS